MCYDISFKTDIETMMHYFPTLVIDGWVDVDFELSVHRQAHAFLNNPVVINEDGFFKTRMFEWGLVANYMNTPDLVKKNRAFMCNARAEKIFDKGSYWYRIRHQRCLIPVLAIYEHRRVDGIKNKVPYHVRWRDREMFCLPGLYNYYPYPDTETGELKGTFTIITTQANQLMQYIHNDGENKQRMPLFLPKELELKWLDSSATDDELKSILEYQAPSNDLEAWTVSTIRTTKERPDGKLKNEPFVWKGVPDILEELQRPE